ncbi:hypothetical protein ACFQXA_08325 [Nocardiopsis composta]
MASDGAAEEAPLSPLLAAVLLGAFLPWPGWAAITGFIWGILFFVYLGVSPAVSGPLLLAAIAAGGGGRSAGCRAPSGSGTRRRSRRSAPLSSSFRSSPSSPVPTSAAWRAPARWRARPVRWGAGWRNGPGQGAGRSRCSWPPCRRRASWWPRPRRNVWRSGLEITPVTDVSLKP